MKRFAGMLCTLLLLASCFLPLHASAENNASSVELYCTVNSDGDCLVSMSVNLHLDSGDPGLMFPIPYNAEKITMNGSSVATSRIGGVTQVAVGRATNGAAGDFPIRFDFTIPNAVKAVTIGTTRRLQLEIPMLCGFDYPVQNLSFIVTLPDSFDSTPNFTSTYQQNGFESNLEKVINGNLLTGATKTGLNDHEAVTMTLLVPQSMFPSVSTYERTGNPEIIPMSILGAIALIYWLFCLRTLPPIRQRATMPPEGISAGELNCRITMTGGDLSLMVLSWAQMGYLTIQQDGRRLLLIKRMEMGNERSLFEVRVFQSLFGNGRRVVDCRSSGYTKLCAKTASMVPGENTMCRPRSGSRKAFRILLCIGQVFCGICVTMNITSIPVLQILFGVIFGVLSAVSAWMIHEFAFSIRSRYRIRAWIALGCCIFWVLLGAIAGQPWVPLCAVLFQLGCSYLTAYGGMRTDLNRSEAGEILGLRKFLRTIPRPEAARLLKADPEYFFRMAPYAIALGVGSRFAAAFGRRKLVDCPYFVTRSRGKHTAEEWMQLMTQSITAMDDRYRRAQIDRWAAVRFRR